MLAGGLCNYCSTHPETKTKTVPKSISFDELASKTGTSEATTNWPNMVEASDKGELRVAFGNRRMKAMQHALSSCRLESRV